MYTVTGLEVGARSLAFGVDTHPQRISFAVSGCYDVCLHRRIRRVRRVPFGHYPFLPYERHSQAMTLVAGGSDSGREVCVYLFVAYVEGAHRAVAAKVDMDRMHDGLARCSG